MKKVLISILAASMFVGILFSQDTNEFDYEYALIEAVRQKTLGNINEAIKLYKRCIEVKPDAHVAAYELGSIYAALNQKEIALNLLKTAYELKSDNYWYLLAYTQILEYSEDYGILIDVLNNYLKYNDDYIMSIRLSDAYFNYGKEKKALKILDIAKREYGLTEQIILKRVEILKSTHKNDAAQKELSKLINLMPESAEYQIIMAEFLEETGKMKEALKFYHNAYELDTTNIYAISNLADYYTEKGLMINGLYFLNRAFSLDEVSLEKKLSTILYFLGEKDTVIKYQDQYEIIIETLLSKYPKNYDVKTIAYDFYNRIGKYEKSYEIILNLLEDKKDNYILWQQAVYNASVLNKYDDIINLGSEALKIFPNKEDLNLFIGIAYYQKNEFEKCYQILKLNYEEGMEINIQGQYLTFLAESSYKLKKIDESFYYFEELLLLQPDNYLVMNNYSYYMALENTTLERAEELSRKTIEKFPENATYIDTYAWILFKLERYAKALEIIERIDMETKVDADILYHYAWILCKNSENSRSIIFFERAKEAGYSNILEIEKGIETCDF